MFTKGVHHFQKIPAPMKSVMECTNADCDTISDNAYKMYINNKSQLLKHYAIRSPKIIQVFLIHTSFRNKTETTCRLMMKDSASEYTPSCLFKNKIWQLLDQYNS
jgi:hypothetical protein